MTVAVLFARADSNYKALPDCDVWDAERDARRWPGGCPVVAHPPCRAWGGLSHMAKPREDEKALAPWAVEQVRKFGGVLEHPASSKLWQALGLPEQGTRDEFGGWTLPIHQHWWGHRAKKKTKLYIVGCEPKDIPEMPMRLDEPTHVIATSTMRKYRVGDPRRALEVTRPEREHTPPQLAAWLVELAEKCKTPNVQIEGLADYKT